ncbi:MAG: 4-(cytidine 5'-diphospho)-2-C-methyl-D-erythritol kinase [Bacteroidota bacterium]
MLILHAYAKINLGLRILRRRSDGYHEVATVFHRVDIRDRILIEAAGDISVRSNSPEAPEGEANICYRAAALLGARFAEKRGAHIAIEKNIPAGAGLGGGSADAAAVLRALPRLWGREADGTTLEAVALLLGSDVPFFLGNRSAFASGRGEILEFFTLEVPHTILVCHPGIHVSTAWAYGRVRPAGDLPVAATRLLKEPRLENRLLAERIRNDFEEPICKAHPPVRDVKELMLRAGAAGSALTGSGSAVYGLFDTAGRAAQAAEQLNSCGYRTFLTPPGFQAPQEEVP